VRLGNVTGCERESLALGQLPCLVQSASGRPAGSLWVLTLFCTVQSESAVAGREPVCLVADPCLFLFVCFSYQYILAPCFCREMASFVTNSEEIAFSSSRIFKQVKRMFHVPASQKFSPPVRATCFVYYCEEPCFEMQALRCRAF
jgi:hypothetical protein